MRSGNNHPFLRKLAGHLIWLLPLVVGISAYLGTRARMAGNRGPVVERAAAAELRPVPYHGDLNRLFDETRAAMNASGPPSSPATPQGSARPDTAALKSRLLELDARMGDLPRWAWSEDDRQELMAVAREFEGREGIAALQWLDEKAPGLRDAAFTAWAEQDPVAAFEAIATSDRLNPCAPATVLTLLERQAQAGPAALLAAVDRVPWHLFPSDPVQDPFVPDPGPRFVPDPASAHFWMSSGAARHLAEQGVYLSGVLGALARTDPEQALAEWTTWPLPAGSPRGLIDLESILQSATRQEDTGDRLRQAILNADETTATRLRAALGDLVTQDPNYANELHQLWPEIAPALPEQEQPQEEDGK
ncbi:MAG: hypothetical protein JWO82_1147 [Akkermansiaceae bacterium]|nr:hypothetical protein [Akkermansiaceae bacterium]